MSSKSLSIPTEPSETYKELKAKADAEGLTVPEYMQREWEKSRPQVSPEELRERIKRRAPFFVGFDVVQAIHEGREERDAQIDEWLKDVGR